MNKSFWILVSLLTILPMSTHAEIYKWKDSNGNIRYTDVPPPSNVPRESIKGNKKVTAPVSADPAEQQQPPATPATTSVKPADPSVNGKDKELTDAQLKIKQHNCEVAKTNLQNLKQGGPVYKESADGKREYLSDKDVAASVQQAQKDIEQYCNG